MPVPETERRANDLCGSVIEIECIGTHRSPDTLWNTSRFPSRELKPPASLTEHNKVLSITILQLWHCRTGIYVNLSHDDHGELQISEYINVRIGISNTIAYTQW